MELCGDRDDPRVGQADHHQYEETVASRACEAEVATLNRALLTFPEIKDYCANHAPPIAIHKLHSVVITRFLADSTSPHRAWQALRWMVRNLKLNMGVKRCCDPCGVRPLH